MNNSRYSPLLYIHRCSIPLYSGRGLLHPAVKPDGHWYIFLFYLCTPSFPCIIRDTGLSSFVSSSVLLYYFAIVYGILYFIFPHLPLRLTDGHSKCVLLISLPFILYFPPIQFPILPKPYVGFDVRI